jgi:hypothetical protein
MAKEVENREEFLEEAEKGKIRRGKLIEKRKKGIGLERKKER